MSYKNIAVVLGTNYYTGLGVVRNLGREGVRVTSIDYEEHHYGTSKYVREKLIAPHYKKQEKELVEFLINYAKNRSFKPVLFPTADVYVEFMENNFDELKKYYLWPNEIKGLYKRIMDKESLLDFTKPLGIKTPEVIDTNEENYYKRVSEEFGYPCIIKPADSMPFVDTYRAKVLKVNSEKELIDTVNMCKNDGHEIFIQRIIKGPDTNCYSFDVYLDKNQEPVSYMTTCKIRQWPINFGASTYAKQVYIKELYDICMPLFKSAKYRGFAEVELKKDEETGNIYLVEVNVRFVNFVELQAHMGMNTPLMYYLDSISEPFSGPKITENKEVYWKYKYEDIPAIREYIRSKQLTLRQVIKDYRFKKVSSTWAWDDPMPGISFFKWAIARRFKKLFK